MVPGFGGREGELPGRGAGLSDHGVVVVEDFLDGDFHFEVRGFDVVVELAVVFFGFVFALRSLC